MQAVFFDAIDTLRVGTTEIPKHGDDEVLLKVHSAGICGTDLHILKGEYGGYFPVIPGHEFSGEVVEVGKNVTRLVPGDRVTVHPGAGYGVSAPGGFEDFVRVRERNAFKIGNLSYDEGALVEPLACVINGIDTVGVNIGDEVLAVEKLTKAKELGADEIFDANHNLKEQLLEAHPRKFHLTIDATGNPSAQEQMVGFTRWGGKFLLFGVAAPDATMTVEPYDIFYRELKIVGVHSFGDKFERAVELAKSRRVNLAEIISHHFPLVQFPDALDLIHSPEPSFKIIMHPEENA
ncbi:MAG: alcohol dehydrogenase catalytic domain-containing protein [Candidatus Poribacteria bacterium]|nr:alcohol dehydrogenase catalytic domain-containing protein [Candidatus Poribacteria bacterium]